MILVYNGSEDQSMLRHTRLSHLSKTVIAIRLHRLVQLAIVFSAFLPGFFPCHIPASCALASDAPVGRIEVRGLAAGKCFMPAGKLHYQYRGLFLPLRNGKILALDGFRYDWDPGEIGFSCLGEDGKNYGYGAGMVELFDPRSGQTKVLTQLPFIFGSWTPYDVLNKQMRAVELKDGRVFLVGQFRENRKLDVEKLGLSKQEIFQKSGLVAPITEPEMFGLIYDWRKGSTEIVKAPKDIQPRCMTTMHVLPDGKVIIVGGALRQSKNSWRTMPETRVLVFDPITKSFSVVGDLLHSRAGHEMLLLNDHEFLLFGGWGMAQQPSSTSDLVGRAVDVELFDLKTGKSKEVGRLLTVRDNFDAIRLAENKILIHGSTFDNYVASELYDIKTGESHYVGEERVGEKIMQYDDPSPLRFLANHVIIAPDIPERICC